MAKGKGSKCPGCSKSTLHDQGSYDKCSKCGYIGWSWRKGVAGVGKGKGNKCPNCENQTLHNILDLNSDNNHQQTHRYVRRCGVCDYSAIEPESPTN